MGPLGRYKLSVGTWAMVMDMSVRRCVLKIIAAASGLGAPDPRCGRGPEAVLDQLTPQVGQLHGIVAPDEAQKLMPFLARLAQQTDDLLRQEARIAVLSGDHSCAIGTWRGVARALSGPLGLIWIDAHMDAHTPASSPSGCWHGMPVAALLGQAGDLWPGENSPPIAPQHLCLIGVRSFEAAEQQLLKTLGVRVITMDEVHRIGFEAAMAEAHKIVTKGTRGYGISIDLDGLDPGDAPGVGSPVVGGVRADDLLLELKRLQPEPRLRAIEIAEYNPVLDVEQRTLQLVLQILKQINGVTHELEH